MKNMIKPVVVLCAICLIVAAALAVTYNAAKAQLDLLNTPEKIIEKNRNVYAKAMPGSDTYAFLPYTAPAEKVGVFSVLEAKAGDKVLGRIFIVKSKGYSSDPLTVAVGISLTGTVTGASIVKSYETPGLGDRVKNPEFLAQFTGSGPFELTRQGGTVDALAGATFSSRGVTEGVNMALVANAGMEGGASN